MQQDTIQHCEGGGRLRRAHADAAPLVSIIVVTYRAVLELPPLLESIFQSQTDDLELIVIDGGSDDGTVEVLRDLDSKIDYWISEPDRGIYDAMMKGIERSRGTFIYHLNAGDLLLRVPIEELRAAERDKIDIASFRVKIDTGRVFSPNTGLLLRYRNTLHHQGTFYRRDTFAGYNCNYRVFADFDLNQRMVFSGAKVRLLDPIVALHSANGISNHAGASEVFRIIRKNCSNFSVYISFILFKWTGLLTRISHLIRRVS